MLSICWSVHSALFDGTKNPSRNHLYLSQLLWGCIADAFEKLTSQFFTQEHTHFSILETNAVVGTFHIMPSYKTSRTSEHIYEFDGISAPPFVTILTH